jgi:aryl-alcohol dehydrogenase-like predicted oxidoreductase
MKNRSRPSEPVTPAVDALTLRATREGTQRFADRFAERFAADFHRETVFALRVSSVGLGTYLGESTDADDAAYESAIAHAVASGINLLDTAINYRSQRSERVIGSVIQRLLADQAARRDELVVCTKGGYIPLDREPPASREAYQEYVRREFIDTQIVLPDEIVAGGHSLAPRFLRYCLAKSRQNLGLRTIDVYYVHNPAQQLASITPGELYRRVRSAFEVLEEAAARGEIGVYGVATWDGLRVPPTDRGHLSLETLSGLAREVGGESHRFRAVQAPISLAMPEAVRLPTQTAAGKAVTLMEAAADLGLTVIGSATLMQARLAGNLPEPIRAQFPGLTTDAQRAIAFSRGIPGIASALVGMKQVRHVDENLSVAMI